MPRALSSAFGPVLGLFAGLHALPAHAIECRLALLLAIDVSSSVDKKEDQLQRGGLVAALTAPEVTAAFFASEVPVALAIYEWSGRYNQEVLLDWTLINTPATLLGAAETVAASTRSHNDFPTAMGYALGYGAGMFQRAPPCLYQTLDMAGDGQNNEGFPPAAAYKSFPFEGITVNGLVVNAADFEAETQLIPFYRDEVIRGPGAFIEVAQGFEDYERAMRRKLERELSLRFIGNLDLPPAALGAGDLGAIVTDQLDTDQLDIGLKDTGVIDMGVIGVRHVAPVITPSDAG